MALFEIISLASLLLDVILLFTSKSTKEILSFVVNLGTSLILFIISSLDRFHIFSENKHSDIFNALLNSSSPCKSVIISFASVF